MKDIDFITLKNMIETAREEKDEQLDFEVVVPIDLAQRILERMVRH